MTYHVHVPDGELRPDGSDRCRVCGEKFWSAPSAKMSAGDTVTAKFSNGELLNDVVYHREVVRLAGDALIEAEVASHLHCVGELGLYTTEQWLAARADHHARVNAAVETLIALRAQTCPTCQGTGDFYPTGKAEDGSIDCPAHCDHGRVRQAS